MKLLLVTLLAGAVMLAGAAPAEAIVPPRNCGVLTVKGKRYTIKADQIRCTTARTWSKRYLTNRTRPRGWSCKSYSSRSTKLRFMCRSRSRSFFAIRR